MNINLSPRAILNNEKLGRIAEATYTAVAVETVLKAIGRPSFIYLDKDTNAETKKYSATKEFLYQALCLSIYLTIIPEFKKAGFVAAKKIYPESKNILDSMIVKVRNNLAKENKTDELNKINNLHNELKNQKGYKKFSNEYKLFKQLFHNLKDNCELDKIDENVKGSVEAVSIIGSIFGLTYLAPQISHVILHPIMNAIGMGKKHDGHAEKPKQPEVQTTGVNVQA